MSNTIQDAERLEDTRAYEEFLKLDRPFFEAGKVYAHKLSGRSYHCLGVLPSGRPVFSRNNPSGTVRFALEMDSFKYYYEVENV